MEWTSNIMPLPIICGTIFIIAALVMRLFPPGKINTLYGYRTPASMKSPERWAFSQKYSTVKMFQSGLFLVVLSFFGLLVPLNDDWSLGLGISLILGAIVYMMVSTEMALKHKFPN